VLETVVEVEVELGAPEGSCSLENALQFYAQRELGYTEYFFISYGQL